MAEVSVADRVRGSRQLTVCRGIGVVLRTLLYRAEVRGVEHVPASGPVLLVVNHRSALDGPLVYSVSKRPAIFLVKDEAFTGVLGFLLRAAGQIPVVRQSVDPAPIRLSQEILAAGGVIGIFPEGTRGAGLAESAFPGAAYLALRSGATVVPVAMHGTTDRSRRRPWHRPPVRIEFGAPIEYERRGAGKALNRRAVAALTDQIRTELGAWVQATEAAA